VKPVLRTLIFVILAINFCQSLVGAFVFGKDFFKPYALFILALTLLYLLLRPIFKTINLPDSGAGYFFLAAVMTTIVLLVLVYIIPSFAITAVKLKKLIILGFVIPSTKLSNLQATLVCGVLISSAFQFFDWLCSKKSK
jgi:hypothetical protein